MNGGLNHGHDFDGIFITTAFGGPPSVILIARSARDGYTPEEMVDEIQVRRLTGTAPWRYGLRVVLTTLPFFLAFFCRVRTYIRRSGSLWRWKVCRGWPRRGRCVSSDTMKKRRRKKKDRKQKKDWGLDERKLGMRYSESSIPLCSSLF